MKERENIEIAIAGDENYLVPLTVLLQSVFVNNAELCVTVNFLFLYSAMGEKPLAQLEELVVSRGHRFRRLGVTDEQLGEVPECRHSKNTFLRLLLPDVLPADVEKVLYLDGDIVVNDSLLPLYRFDVSDAYIAAVKDPTIVFGAAHCRELGLPEGYPYFNAGVVLMNIARIREDKMQRAFFDYIRQYMDIIDTDQDILNGTLYSAVKYLPPVYNYNFWMEKDVAARLFSPEEIKAVWHHPVIIHYIGPVKPWHYKSLHPRKSLWWCYLRQTSYKGFRPIGKTPSAVCNRLFRQLFVRPFKSLLTVETKQKLGRFLPRALRMKLKQLLSKAQ